MFSRYAVSVVVEYRILKGKEVVQAGSIFKKFAEVTKNSIFE